MSQEEICHLITWPGTSKTISKEALASAFPEELAAGKARVKKELLSEWLDVVRNGEDHARWRAIEFGLKVINGWRDDERPSVSMNFGGDGDATPKLSVEFILPSRPQAIPDHTPYTPGHTRYDTRHTPHDGGHTPPQRTRLEPSPDDLVLDKVQPSAFKAKRGGFDWS